MNMILYGIQWNCQTVTIRGENQVRRFSRCAELLPLVRLSTSYTKHVSIVHMKIGKSYIVILWKKKGITRMANVFHVLLR